MKQIKWLRIISLFLFFFLGPMLAVSATVQAQATDVIRNGDFSAGLAEWVLNPKIDAAWNPLGNGAVNLHPPSIGMEGFTGTVIYQNLNVPGVGGKAFHFSMDLLKTSAGDGNTIAVIICYVDTANGLQEATLLNPSNADISGDPQNPTHLAADYTFPADARKLVKIEIEKRNYGDFTGDNVQFTADGITPEAIPLITGLSTAGGNYGSSLIIAGQNFGTTQGEISIGGSTAGVNVTAWSPASVSVTVQDPARSGRVYVVSDFVESNIDYSFEVASPNYTITPLNDSPVVVKGQALECLIRVDFLNGFTTQAGVGFAVQNLPAGATATFLPVPVKNTGGVLLKIDTSNLNPGDYQITISANEPNTAARMVSLFLQVVTISDIRFYETTWDPVNQINITTYLTSKEVTSQGQFYINVEAIDSRGNTWTTWSYSGEVSPLSLQSSDPTVMGVYSRAFGPEIYALDTGTANLVAATPDGYQESLQVNVSISPPEISSIGLFPQTVYNTSTDSLTFSADSTDTLSWVGLDSSGMMNFGTDFLDPNNLVYSNENKSVRSIFGLTKRPADLGMVLFYASTGGSRRVIPLTLVSDPSLSELRGGVRLLDDVFAEVFTLEFYDPSNGAAPLFTRELFLMHGDKNFDVGGILPGTYKLRLSTGDSLVRPQWYSNADDFSSAAPVTFAQGLVDNIYFFLRSYPTILFSGSIKLGGSTYPTEGVEAASVEVVDNFSVWSQTDANGDFLLTGIRAGQDFALRISKTGYTTVYSAIYNCNESITAPLPYGLFPEGQPASWGVTTGNGMILGRVAQASAPTAYLAGATISAADATNPQTAFPVTYLLPDGTFGGTATSENGVYAVLNVPAGTTVRVGVAEQGWTFQSPQAWLKVYDGAISEESFFGTSVEEPDIRQGFADAMAAYDAGNVAGFMALVSPEFLDNASNRSQFEAEISDMIQSGEPLAYSIQSVAINGDQAAINLIWNGVEADTLYFRKEGENWMLYGNQRKYDLDAWSGHTAESYWVSMSVDDPNDAITSVSVTGPGISGSINLVHDTNDKMWVSWPIAPPYTNFGPQWPHPETPPAPPLVYTFNFTDGQGNSTMTATVKNFVEVFATPVSPTGGASLPELTSFAWTGVGVGYRYRIELNDSSWARLWDSGDNDIAGASVPYIGSALATGSYSYNLLTVNMDGNFFMVTVPFTIVPPKGDINGDMNVTLADAILALKVMSGMDSTGVTLSGDVDGDGKIGFAELIYVLQKVGGVRP